MDQNALIRRILENINTSVLMFDQDLRLSYINPAGEILLAVSARRTLGLHASQLLDGPDNFITNLQHAMESGHPFTERELAFNTPDKRHITIDCTVTPLSDGAGNNALLIELAQMDRQLRIAREEALLAEHNATRDVVRGLAHEIKNPLGGLRGAAQLLERQLDNDELKEYTGIIIGEADRLQNLLNRMLGPNALPQKKQVNVHELLERVRQLTMTEAPPNIKIKRDYDPSLPDLYADPEQLIQALLNLVRNAIQALGEQGTVTLRTRAQRQFTIGSRRHKLVASIEVIDNGPGIAPEMLKKIFYPMVTGRAEGTGLGLAIAQTLINQHDGLIECHSQPGEETVFTILIPLEN